MENQLRLIKKYPNRRLYDTKTSSYITLADVKQMVLKQEEFQVVDAKSGDDLTRQGTRYECASSRLRLRRSCCCFSSSHFCRSA